MHWIAGKNRVAQATISILGLLWAVAGQATPTPAASPLLPPEIKDSVSSSDDPVFGLYKSKALSQIAYSGKQFSKELLVGINSDLASLFYHYNKALSIEGPVQEFLRSEIENLGMEDDVAFVTGRTKSWESIIEKGFLRKKIRGSSLTDIAGQKIIFQDGKTEQLLQLIQHLSSHPDLKIVEELEDNFSEPRESGYRDFRLKISFEGVVVEIIFNFESIHKISQKERIEVYEKERVGQLVDAKIKQRFQNLYQLTAAMVLKPTDSWLLAKLRRQILRKSLEAWKKKEEKKEEKVAESVAVGF